MSKYRLHLRAAMLTSVLLGCTAPSLEEIDAPRVRDSKKVEVTKLDAGASVTVVADAAPEADASGTIRPSLRVFTSMSTVGEGEHVVGGKPCPAGAERVGEAPDCEGGTCHGNVFFCRTHAPMSSLESGREVFVDLAVTPSAQHIDEPACPNGFVPTGRVVDAGNAVISGHQLLCAKKAPVETLGSGSTVVVDFFLSASGVHATQGVACPVGFRPIGGMADCGDGLCFGNKHFCVKTEVL